MMKKSILILSGGLDSTTLLYKLLKEKKDVFVISFDYGQRHKKELEMAKLSCKKLSVDHKIVDVQSLRELISNSSLTSDNIEVPEESYQDESMRITVVPNRNMIFASIAIGYAVNIGADEIALGVHSGDHAIYPDCREEFIVALREVAKIANYKPIDVYAPFLNSTKGDIVKEGTEMGVDYSLTWSCYKGEEKPCGKCGSCQERKEAFDSNNLIDPL
ncbi:7-cyano-7-deazaguanine synthase QueC [Patescibacteria group bacterium]|nr:7-cyano-7-deazaguanine synthase QueC [Patescibacteria group bacterium]HOC78592.1 7-cyano-7-deazaguanine synthase QueC [Methanofastidiosum sp.]